MIITSPRFDVRPSVCFLIIINLALFAGWARAHPRSSPLTLEQRFAELSFEHILGGYEGCFVLYDRVQNTTLRHNAPRCEQRFPPCSTFKIFNTMAGLDAGFLKDAGTVLKWDGAKQPYASWERDHDLASAIRHSVVWYYRQVAVAVGASRMQAFLDAVGYGNRDISSGIDGFWLGASLQISAEEQIKFLDRLYDDDLPFSDRAMAIARDIIVLERSSDAVFSGKTGSHYYDGRFILGWFVGRLQTVDGDYLFALNLSGKGASGQRAKTMTRTILTELLLWPGK